MSGIVSLGRNVPARNIIGKVMALAAASAPSTQEEYTEVLAGFLQELRKKGAFGKEVDLRSLAHALIALYNGLEITLVSGLSVAEARRAWLEALKALFKPQHDSRPA